MELTMGFVAAFAYDLTIYDGDGFLPCDGRQVPVSQNSALYSLISNTYGGNSVAFNLPDLRGRVILGAGIAPGLTPRALGRVGGAENVVLTMPQLPAHNHPVIYNQAPLPVTGTITATMSVNNTAAGQGTPSGNYLGELASSSGDTVYANSKDTTTLNTNAITVNNSLTVNLAGAQLNTGLAGQSQPVKTMPPYLCLYYGINTGGLYPTKQ